MRGSADDLATRSGFKMSDWYTLILDIFLPNGNKRIEAGWGLERTPLIKMQKLIDD